MRTISVLTVVAGVSLGAWAGLDPEAFANPPAAARPWAYWLWQNGNVEAEDVTADLEAIKRLGFGGVLMFDNRGYGYADWLPPVRLEVMTDPWFDRVAFAIRECARIGLEFSMNASCGGFAHRRSAADDVDVYFITGPVSRSVTVRAPLAGRRAELWDPVTGKRAPADATRFRDGRTRIRLNLPKGGSAFVISPVARLTRQTSTFPDLLRIQPSASACHPCPVALPACS